MIHSPLNAFILFIIHTISPQITSAAIADHQATIKHLRQNMKKARSQLTLFHTLTTNSQKAAIRLTENLNKLYKKVPSKITEAHDIEFRHYPNNTIIYTSKKGQGILIPKKEKLYTHSSPQNSFNYTKIDDYLFQKRKKRIRIYSAHFSYQHTPTHTRLIHINNHGKTLYTYTKKTHNPRFHYETIRLPNKNSYILTTNSLNSPSTKESFSINSQRILISQDNTKYFITDSLHYTLHTNGNISMSKNLREALLKEKRYYHDIITDLKNSPIIPYIHFLLSQNSETLQKPSTILLALINHFRAQHALSPLTFNKTLTKITRKHSHYFSQHHPHNPHYQHYTHKGYFGKTVFQRRKHFKYPYRVKEWISWNNDPLYTFYTLILNKTWKKILSQKKAIHIGYTASSYTENTPEILLIGNKK